MSVTGLHADAAGADRRRRRLIQARSLAGFGGLALFSSFFLPAVEGCGSAITPAWKMWEWLTDPAIDWRDLPDAFMLLVAAYLFGLIVVVEAGQTLASARTWARRTGPAHFLFAWVACGMTWIWIGPAIVVDVHRVIVGRASRIVTPPLDWDFIQVAVVSTVIVVYLWRSRRAHPLRPVFIAWASSLCAVYWFGTLWFLGKTYYGLKLSLLGSLGIGLGAFFEAKWISGESAWVTLVGLVKSRLPFNDPDGPRCDCGYLLIGLESPRCPECGAPVEFAEPMPGRLGCTLASRRLNATSDSDFA